MGIKVKRDVGMIIGDVKSSGGDMSNYYTKAETDSLVKSAENYVLKMHSSDIQPSVYFDEQYDDTVVANTLLNCLTNGRTSVIELTDNYSYGEENRINVSVALSNFFNTQNPNEFIFCFSGINSLRSAGVNSERCVYNVYLRMFKNDEIYTASDFWFVKQNIGDVTIDDVNNAISNIENKIVATYTFNPPVDMGTLEISEQYSIIDKINNGKRYTMLLTDHQTFPNQGTIKLEEYARKVGAYGNPSDNIQALYLSFSGTACLLTDAENPFTGGYQLYVHIIVNTNDGTILATRYDKKSIGTVNENWVINEVNSAKTPLLYCSTSDGSTFDVTPNASELNSISDIGANLKVEDNINIRNTYGVTIPFVGKSEYTDDSDPDNPITYIRYAFGGYVPTDLEDNGNTFNTVSIIFDVNTNDDSVTVSSYVN